MKKVLVIGGGGREHAIVDALSRSLQVGKIYCAPGNAGISAQAECVAIKDTDVEGLKAFALEKDINISEADIDPSDKKTKKLYEGGIHITVNKYEDSKQIEITNDKGEEILYAQVKNGANAPVMEYTKGKYNHNRIVRLRKKLHRPKLWFPVRFANHRKAPAYGNRPKFCKSVVFPEGRGRWNRRLNRDR